MTVKELKEKLDKLPDGAIVELELWEFAAGMK